MPHGGDIYTNKVNMDFSVNLNPLMPQQLLKEAMMSATERICHYPDPGQKTVRKLIGKTDKIDPQKIIAGSGASELIMAVIKAVEPKNALLIEPCFSGYRHALSSLKDCNVTEYHLKYETGFLLSEEMIGCIKEDTDLIFLCDPWNPTGKNIECDLLESILKRAKDTNTKVILDQSFLLMSEAWERYYEAQRLTDTYEDLYIIRSFTKLFSCPGVRIGYVACSKNNINDVIKNLPEWNLSVNGECIIQKCMPYVCCEDYLKDLKDSVKEERAYLTDALSGLNITVYDSDTVFMLLKTGMDLYDKLLKRGILIRDCEDFKALGKGYFRIAVKTREENKILTDTIGRIIDGY